YGQTCSYAQMARDIGRPGAARAIGRANGANRIAIVIPCHRVIRADGALCGYGGGVERKRWLLELEGWGESRNLTQRRQGAKRGSSCCTAETGGAAPKGGASAMPAL